MQIVCSYCRRKLGTKAPLDDPSFTHGMCGECDDYFRAQWSGMGFDEYLNRFPFPVLLVEEDVRVVALNKEARKLVGSTECGPVGLLGGEALECARARLPGGCGKTAHCATCAIRNTVTRTHRTGEPMSHVPAILGRREKAISLFISTVREGRLVRVTVEPGVGDSPAPDVAAGAG